MTQWNMYNPKVNYIVNSKANLSAITEPNGLLPNQQVSLSTLFNKNVISQTTSISLAPEDQTMTPIEQHQKVVDRKNTFYLARCEAVDIDFTTFVVDSIRGIHPDAARLITRIAILRYCTVSISRTRLMQRKSLKRVRKNEIVERLTRENLNIIIRLALHRLYILALFRSFKFSESKTLASYQMLVESSLKTKIISIIKASRYSIVRSRYHVEMLKKS
jgi:hypothetical protein